MRLLQMSDPVRFPRMTTEELRSTFLLDDMFQPGEIKLSYIDLDRAVTGAAVPTDSALRLETSPELRSGFFCERRELGVLNVGGSGTITVDGKPFEMSKLDCLYIGRGSRDVSFTSKNSDDPAAFYLLSYLAHAQFPTALARFSDLKPVQLGSVETCNRRSIYKAIHRDGLQSCQLVMGFTLLEEGSNWNTMPAHTHMRRSEIYMYFDVDTAHRIVHLMGPPQQTRHLLLADRSIVVSPGWSIHSGVGTTRYGFCWGMGGENKAYDDMDPVAITDLR